DNREALHGLGASQFRLTQYDEAAKTFERLTRLAPDDMNSWINLSLSLQRKGDDAGATAALEEALKQDAKGPRVAAVRRALAARYYRKGDADNLARAQEQYTLSLQDTPDNPEALNGLGLIAQKQGKVDDAINYFKKAVAINPRYADAFNNLGVA